MSISPPIVTTVVAAPFRAPTIVSVQLGEAVTVAQDRPVIATISDGTGTLRSRQCTLNADSLERF